MKIALYSDLHRETYRSQAWTLARPAADLVILAGDIGSDEQGLHWAAQTFAPLPIIYVAGNHEYYGGSLARLAQFRQTAAALGIHFLEEDELHRDGVRFLGCTLWSDFDLYGAEQRELAMSVAGALIKDYGDIDKRPGQALTPADSRRLHRQSLAWLERALAQPFTGKTVVISHFAPHRRCVAPRFAASPVSPYFVSDLAPLLERHRIDLWCHGHTHTNNDFIAASGCRIIANQRGYPKEFAAGTMDFRADLLIEL